VSCKPTFSPNPHIAQYGGFNIDPVSCSSNCECNSRWDSYVLRVHWYLLDHCFSPWFRCVCLLPSQILLVKARTFVSELETEGLPIDKTTFISTSYDPPFRLMGR